MGIEEAQILARFDGDVDLAREVSEMFINECPKHLNDLCTAIRDGNAKALEGSAHAVKGSIGNFSTKGARVRVEARTTGAVQSTVTEDDKRHRAQLRPNRIRPEGLSQP